MGLSYNPNNENIFDVTNEKTDHRTDNKTDHKTDRKTDYNTNVTHCRGRWFWRTCGWPTKFGSGPYAGQYINDVHARFNKENKEANERGRQMNEENTKLNADNAVLNEKNKKRNKAYADAVTIAKTTQSGEYAAKRNQLRNSDTDEDAKSAIEQQFKAFYRDKKLQVWDSRLGTKPDFGDFDPSYYGTTYQNVKNKYKEYEDDDDIDVTEGYGRENC